MYVCVIKDDIFRSSVKGLGYHTPMVFERELTEADIKDEKVGLENTINQGNKLTQYGVISVIKLFPYENEELKPGEFIIPFISYNNSSCGKTGYIPEWTITYDLEALKNRIKIISKSLSQKENTSPLRIMKGSTREGAIIKTIHGNINVVRIVMKRLSECGDVDIPFQCIQGCELKVEGNIETEYRKYMDSVFTSNTFMARVFVKPNAEFNMTQNDVIGILNSLQVREKKGYEPRKFTYYVVPIENKEIQEVRLNDLAFFDGSGFFGHSSLPYFTKKKNFENVLPSQSVIIKV